MTHIMRIVAGFVILVLFNTSAYATGVSTIDSSTFVIHGSAIGPGEPQVAIQRDAPGANGQGGFIRFQVKNSAGLWRDAAQINGGLTDITNGAENGDFDFGIYVNGAVRIMAMNGTNKAFQPDDASTEMFTLGTPTARWNTAYVANVQLQTSQAKPACSVTHRGKIWVANGGVGVKDEVSVCTKDAADVYAWRVIW